MASNTTLNVGASGDIITTKERTHDGDATKQQVVSLAFVTGTEGAYTHTDAVGGAGAVTAGVQRTTLASDDPAVVALQLLDNAVSGSGYNITQLNGVNVTMGNGASGTGVQRVTLASDSTGVLAGVTTVTTVSTVTNVATIGTSVTPGTSAAHLGKAVDAVAGAADTGVASLYVRDDALTTLTPVDGDYVPGRVTSTGAQWVAIASGGIAGIVDDAAFTPATSEVLPIGFTFDNTATDSVDEGDIGAARMSANRNIYVNIRDNAGNERGLNVDASGQIGVTVASLPASTNTLEVVGDAAHDAAIAGNPVRVAARGMSADYTAVATGDTADILATLLGKQVTQPYALPGNTWSYAAASGGIVNTTGVTAKAAAGAGVRNYITQAQVINGHATVSTDVQIRDGAAGTVLHRGFAQAAGGGFACTFDPPIRGTANTLVEIACGTTGSAVYVNLQGYVAGE